MTNSEVQDIKYDLKELRKVIPNISKYYKRIGLIQDENKRLFVEILKSYDIDNYEKRLLDVFSRKSLDYMKCSDEQTFNIIVYHVRYMNTFLRNNNTELTFDKILKISVKKYWDNFLPTIHSNAYNLMSVCPRFR